MSDQTLPPEPDWAVFLTHGVMRGMATLQCSRDQLARIWTQLRGEYEAQHGVRFTTPMEAIQFNFGEPGLVLFGLAVVIDDTIEAPTLFPKSHFSAGVESFARQVNDPFVRV